MFDKLNKLVSKRKKVLKTKRFCVFFYERSGSTYLCDLLNHHPLIKCEMETFWLNWNLKKKASLYSRRQYTPEEALHTLENIYQNSTKTIQSAGFKFKYPNQYRAYPEVWDFLKSNSADTKIIFLYRINKLRAIVSTLNHKNLISKYNVSNIKTNDRIDLEPLEINVKKVKKLVWERHKLDQTYLKIAKKNFPFVLPIAYEDLCNDKNKTIDNILEFLEIEKPSHELVSSFKKASEINLDKLIVNYDELKESFTCTPLEIYLKVD